MVPRGPCCGWVTGRRPPRGRCLAPLRRGGGVGRTQRVVDGPIADVAVGFACAAIAAAPACACARCVCAGCSPEPRFRGALADLDAGPEHDLVGDQRHPHDAQIVAPHLRVGLPVGQWVREDQTVHEHTPLRASTSMRLGHNAMTRLQSNACTDRQTALAGGKKRKEPAARRLSVVVSQVPHTPVVHGAGDGWRMVRDSDPRSMRSVVMPARLASGCLRPLGQPSKGIGYEKAHPRWDRLFRYSDYTRQRNTESGHGSSVAGISFVLGLGACQRVPECSMPNRGRRCRVPGILPRVRQFFKSLPLTATPVFSRTHRAASACVRVMCMSPALRRYSNRTRFKSSHAPHSGAHRIPRGAGGVDRRAYRLVVVPFVFRQSGAYADKTALAGVRGGGFDLFR